MRTLLIDGNGLQWRSYHSRGVADDGVRVGIFNYIFSLLYKFKPDDLIVFWDISKSRWRRSVYDGYKADREKLHKENEDLEEIIEQANKAKEQLESLRVRNVQVSGIEADDLISWFSEYYSNYLGYEVIIATGDKDLWQLINNRVKVYNHLKDVLVDYQYVINNMGVVPEKISQLKSLMGDSSDNIKAIKGIGEKSALELLQNYESIWKLLDNEESLRSKKRTARILEDFDTIPFCYNLVKSPSFYDGRWYLKDSEYSDLEKCLRKDLEKDMNVFSMVYEDVDTYFRRGISYIPKNTTDTSILNYLKPFELGEIQYKDLYSCINGCRNCSLGLSGRKFLPQIGENSKNMLVVDDYDYEKVAEFLEEIGESFDNFWLTTPVKCDTNESRLYGQVKACSWFLKNEISILKPKLIISFGTNSMNILTGLGGKSVDKVGEHVDLSEEFFGKKVPCKVFVMNNYKYLGISEKEKINYEYGLEKLKNLLKGDF